MTWTLGLSAAGSLVIVYAYSSSETLVMQLCFLPSLGLTLIGLAVTYAKIHFTLKRIGKDVQKKSIQDHVSRIYNTT